MEENDDWLTSLVLVEELEPWTEAILGILKLEKEVLADEDDAGAPATGTPR